MSAAPSPRATALEMAMQRAAVTVGSLDEHQLVELAAGRAQLVLQAVAKQERTLRSVAHPPAAAEPAARQAPGAVVAIDIAGVVATVNGADTPAEAEAYLRGLDSRFTLAVLKEIARACGPTVATSGRTRAQVQRDIVAGTVGFRARSAAMSGGAWA